MMHFIDSADAHKDRLQNKQDCIKNTLAAIKIKPRYKWNVTH